MGKIFAFYGPSASGKSEIQRELTVFGYPKIITATTRPPRSHEEDGVHYLFMTTEQFEHALAEHSFIEWTSYNGNYYGTLKASIEEALRQDGKAHIVLDLAGVLALKQLYADTVAVYIGANISTITRRLKLRGGAADETESRIQKAEQHELSIEYTQHADVIVWNHDGVDFNDTMLRVRNIIAGNQTD
ncbi:guanylate kinase [Paenibacillus endophyticus]|uniref:Guanylate kinase n=1 Tax=Paenibacillus endophyticus TaxID=1294268 RepID=A0A7W5CG42_9BACL|nr:guanylate kinase [Paenibacillus endophyticus]MBB3156229.1 guanylate kinase [Paenibacillus endophyticus]